MLDDGTIERLANAVATRVAALTSHPEGVVSQEGAAKILGVAPATIRLWRSQGKLPPPSRLGARVVWTRSAWDDFLANLPPA